ncbi:hypothetical protein ACFLY7_00800 [Patescibacteria group bacterium]
MIFNITKLFKDFLSTVLIFSVLFFFVFVAFEPGLVRALEDQVVVTQEVTSGITISSPSDITMTTLTLTQDTAVATSTWTVTTNSQSGFTVTIDATSTSACVDRATDGQEDILCALGSNSGIDDEAFRDLATTTRAAWSTMTTGNDYYFGFSVTNVLADNTADVSGWGNDSIYCDSDGSDTPNENLLWQGFWSGNEIEIASSTSETDQGGTQIAVCLATAQVGSGIAPSGTYYATTTATALVQ